MTSKEARETQKALAVSRALRQSARIEQKHEEERMAIKNYLTAEAERVRMHRRLPSAENTIRTHFRAQKRLLKEHKRKSQLCEWKGKLHNSPFLVDQAPNQATLAA